MTLNILFSAADESWPAYQDLLPQTLDDIGIPTLVRRDFAPQDVDYIVYAPDGPTLDFGAFNRARAVLGLWAGVEKIVTNPTLHLPLTRMVDCGLSEGMVEWVTGHVLRHHLGIDKYIRPARRDWTPDYPVLARDRSVAILGLGQLGQACAQALQSLNFNVLGWSRRKRSPDNIAAYHGTDGLDAVLRRAEILVLLLPLTDATRNIIDEQSLGKMPRQAVIMNPGRGALIDDDALIRALDSGQLAHATLDVFRVEPLPDSHPFWHHPQITVTPHIAAQTRPKTACQVIAENIRRDQAGEEMQYLVDRSAGY